MTPKISPLNIPARMRQEVAGNPVNSRLETVPANCAPGLEIDNKNLDRRFFPGLVFEFLLGGQGALLVDTDLTDPDIPNKAFQDKIRKLQSVLSTGRLIFLQAITQKVCIPLVTGSNGGQAKALNGNEVWRLVRSLEPGEVTIELSDRQSKKEIVHLTANRRAYQNKDGEISSVYKPGELSQTLCSPWQHDFRDCSCTYWASNHPDIVLPVHSNMVADRFSQDNAAADAERQVLWMRWDRKSQVSPRLTQPECRASEMDYYEINSRWRDLDIVLEGAEQRAPYSVEIEATAVPLSNADLVPELKRLAAIEHALAVEYLYARYSVVSDENSMDRLRFSEEKKAHARFIAHELLTIAVGEMNHLRWVNQILWELFQSGQVQTFTPVLDIAEKIPQTVPGSKQSIPDRETQMLPLDLALEHFIEAEAGSGTVGGQYVRIHATLRKSSSPDLSELASRIIADGISHFSKLRQVQTILKFNEEGLIRKPYRDISESDPLYGSIKSMYAELLENLRQGYQYGNPENRGHIVKARQLMAQIDQDAIQAAVKGKAIPFLQIGRAGEQGLPAHA